ncbi:hypothetical protein WJX73_005376 [Symbiochloris irregularis]|uniref:Bromo domain-containing protein n=1 Tax=Symbiochloris irregularis TaxID=706552 RepID=A0AAW1P421_9CHLO
MLADETATAPTTAVAPGGATDASRQGATGEQPSDKDDTRGSDRPVAQLSSFGAGVLDAFLTSIAKLDEFKFFSEPVRDEDAPGYARVITDPMDLQTMAEKAAGRVYKTFGEFTNDFKLMCSNAMLYNQKRSRVHKTAVTMLRAGMALSPQKAPRAPPKKAVKPSPPKKARGAPQKPPKGVQKMKQPQVALTEPDDWQAELPVDNDACYSSFSETDDEQAGPRTATAAINAHDWLAWLGRPLLVQQLHNPEELAASDLSAAAAFEGEPAAAELWKTRRRATEWRIRWLELRMQDLAARELRYRSQLDGFPQPASTDALAAAAQPKATPSDRQQQPAGATPADVPPSEMDPVLDVEDGPAAQADADIGPCAFTALDMLEARLEMLQMHMQHVPGVARPQPVSGSMSMRGRGRGRGGSHPQKRMRVTMAPPSLDRQVSKRRREESDYGEGYSSYQSTPRIEKLQVLNINIPAHEVEEHIKFTASQGTGAQKKPPSKATLKTMLDDKSNQQLTAASSAPPGITPVRTPVTATAAAAAAAAAAALPAADGARSPLASVAAPAASAPLNTPEDTQVKKKLTGIGLTFLTRLD